MAEFHDQHGVPTIDGDFFAYRKHGRVLLTLIAPDIGTFFRGQNTPV